MSAPLAIRADDLMEADSLVVEDLAGLAVVARVEAVDVDRGLVQVRPAARPNGRSGFRKEVGEKP
jgi:hypothetical protein